MRRLLPAVLCAVLALGLPAGASAARATVTPVPESPVQVAVSSIPRPGRSLSSQRALTIASAVAKVRDARRGHPGSYGAVYTKGPFRWQVSFFSRGPRPGGGGGKELAQVIIADRTGRVLEAWSGFQVAWTMARGYKGAFGEHVNALYIWIPLCLLFIAPFFDFRRPLSLLHLDLLVLLSFSVSLAFFNHANIWASVPLVYPPLLYLLARMLWLLRRRASGAPPAATPAAADTGPLAGGRGGVPDRLPGGAERDRLERHRRRLRGRDRGPADHGRPAPVRGLPGRQRTRGHLRAVQLRGVRPLPADLRLERALGRPAGGPWGGDLLRPAGGRVAVPAGAADARPHPRHRLRLRVGLLSVHVVRAREQRQRHVGGGHRAGGPARRQLRLGPGPLRARGLRRAGRPDEARSAGARPDPRHRRPARAAPTPAGRLAGAVRERAFWCWAPWR